MKGSQLNHTVRPKVGVGCHFEPRMFVVDDVGVTSQGLKHFDLLENLLEGLEIVTDANLK